MVSKKNPELDLEKKRPLFFQLGLLIAGALALSAFEWQSFSSEKTIEKFDFIEDEPTVLITEFKTKEEEKKKVVRKKVVVADLQTAIIKTTKDESVKTEFINLPNLDSLELNIVDPNSETEPLYESVFYNPNAITPKVDQLPKFNGDLSKWVSENLNFPLKGKRMMVSDKVKVRFVVNRDGSIRDIKITRGQYDFFNKESIRIVSKMPNWKPGLKDGKAVNTYMVLPITFKLTQ